MRLRKGDEVIAVERRRSNDADLLVVTENGYGKRTRIDEYPRKGRGGLGVKTVQLTEARGQLAGARVVRDGYQVMLISTGGTVIRIPVEDVKRARPLDAGRDRHAPAEGRAGLHARAGGRARGRRTGGRVAEPSRRSKPPANRPSLPIEFQAVFGRNPSQKLLKSDIPCAPRGSVSRRERVMAVSRQVDLLEPIDLAEHLDKIELYLGQVCQIAGISKMQLDYWTNKAQIPTKGRKQRIYDMDALETVMLIKQAKDKGLNLGAAIEAAQRFRELNGDDADGSKVRSSASASRFSGGSELM